MNEVYKSGILGLKNYVIFLPWDILPDIINLFPEGMNITADKADKPAQKKYLSYQLNENVHIYKLL